MNNSPYNIHTDSAKTIHSINTQNIDFNTQSIPDTAQSICTDAPDGSASYLPVIAPKYSILQVSPSSRTVRKNASKHVSFGHVNLYHFDRLQGFTCVPSQGGSTLGMTSEHWAKEDVPVMEHQRRRKHQRYSTLLRFCLEGKLLLSLQQFRILEARVKQQQPQSTSEAGGESSTCMGSLKRLLDEGTDSCDEDLSFLDNLEEYYFLQPLPVKRRRIMLRKSGLQRIDPSEKNECTEIRRSRSECGCTCAGGLCDPVTCECALNDIPCQVDRVAFPCACVAPAHCANPAGRTEFNLARVRTHYFHTRLRLDAETARERSSCGEVKKQRLLEGGTATNLSFTTAAQSTNSTLSSNGGCRDCQNDGYVYILMQDFQCIQQNQHLQQQQQQQDQTPSPIFGRDNNNDPSVGGELPTTNEENACLKVDANIFGDMHQAQPIAADESPSSILVEDATADDDDEDEEEDDEEEDEGERDTEEEEEEADDEEPVCCGSDSQHHLACRLEPIASLFHSSNNNKQDNDASCSSSSSSSNILGSSPEHVGDDEERPASPSRPPSVCEVVIA